MTHAEEDADLRDELINRVVEIRGDYRRAMRRIVTRWRGLRKRGEVIEDTEYATRLLRSYIAGVAACDRWFKANT